MMGFVAAGLRGLGADVTTPPWPDCLTAPPDRNTSCAGRVLVVVGFYCNAEYTRDIRTAWSTGTPTILFNLEVVTGNTGCFSKPAWAEEPGPDIWATSAVWDYSPLNVVAMGGAGLLAPGGGNAAAVPLGYFPGVMLQPDLPPWADGAPPRNHSVLMLATPNDRRQGLASALRARGVDVMWPMAAVSGAPKEELLRASRVLLNVHYFDQKLMESVRLFHAASIGVACVSEDSPDVVASEYWAKAVDLVPYDNLVDHVVALLAAPDKVDALARRGYAWMRAESASQRLLPALLTALKHLKVEHALK